MSELFIGLGVLVCFLILLELYKRKTSKSISKKAYAKAKKAIESYEKMPPHQSLLASHSLLIKTLKPLYTNTKTAAELMTKLLKNKPNKAYWEFHNLRNKAAHEPEFIITKAQSKNARIFFLKLLKQISK